MDNSQLMTSTFNKTKFNWRSPSMDRGSVDKFTSANSSWSSGHMYRTSYRDMSSKDQAPLKAYAIAKYAGFIPGKEGNSDLGRVYTKVTRRCFDKEEKFQKTHKRFKSTGFHGDQQNFDTTRPSFFRGYGKETLLGPHPPFAHPCLDEEWSTTFRKTFLHPQSRTKMNTHIKLTGAECEFDEQMVN